MKTSYNSFKNETFRFRIDANCLKNAVVVIYRFGVRHRSRQQSTVDETQIEVPRGRIAATWDRDDDGDIVFFVKIKMSDVS